MKKSGRCSGVAGSRCIRRDDRGAAGNRSVIRSREPASPAPRNGLSGEAQHVAHQPTVEDPQRANEGDRADAEECHQQHPRLPLAEQVAPADHHQRHHHRRRRHPAQPCQVCADADARVALHPDQVQRQQQVGGDDVRRRHRHDLAGLNGQQEATHGQDGGHQPEAERDVRPPHRVQHGEAQRLDGDHRTDEQQHARDRPALIPPRRRTGPRSAPAPRSRPRCSRAGSPWPRPR